MNVLCHLQKEKKSVDIRLQLLIYANRCSHILAFSQFLTPTWIIFFCWTLCYCGRMILWRGRTLRSSRRCGMSSYFPCGWRIWSAISRDHGWNSLCYLVNRFLQICTLNLSWWFFCCCELPGKEICFLYRIHQVKCLLFSGLHSCSLVRWYLILVVDFRPFKYSFFCLSSSPASYQIPIALDMAKDFRGKEDADLFRKIKSDDFMRSAVIECYETLRYLLVGILEDKDDKM